MKWVRLRVVSRPELIAQAMALLPGNPCLLDLGLRPGRVRDPDAARGSLFQLPLNVTVLIVAGATTLRAQRAAPRALTPRHHRMGALHVRGLLPHLRVGFMNPEHRSRDGVPVSCGRRRPRGRATGALPRAACAPGRSRSDGRRRRPTRGNHCQ